MSLLTHSKELKDLHSHYDFIIVGSGPAGCVVASGLATNPNVSVLLIEAGGTDAVPEVQDANQWWSNLESERNWHFKGEADTILGERSLPYHSGKVLGGGSSINASAWARGHRSDWNYLQALTGESGWAYEAVVKAYQRIEQWTGALDNERRGRTGPLCISPSLKIGEGNSQGRGLGPAFLAAVSEQGIPLFDQQNGALMEAPIGASLTDLCACDGRRSSVFQAYVAPLLQQGNLDLITKALVTKITLRGSKAVGVEVEQDGTRRGVESVHEVIVSAGALQTPKLLMQSGIGPAPELEQHGIPVLHALPGIGQNLQDHTVANLAFQAPKEMPSQTVCPQAAAFLRSSGNSSPAPDMYVFVVEGSVSAADGLIWALGAMLLRPESHGTLRLSGPHASDPPRIEGHLLSEKHDLEILIEGTKFCQEVAQSEAMRGCIQRQLSPALSSDDQLATYIAQTASSCWHVCGTCKMGTDAMSVVNSAFEVHGLAGLRIADASVLPRVPLGNTMASTIIVGAEAVRKITGKYGL